MSAKSVGIAGLMALAALALIAVIASNPFSTQASTHEATESQETHERLSADAATPSQIARPDQLGQMQATDEEDEDSENTQPYIGVAIVELEDGSVKVVRVQQDGPSDSVLVSGDLITAVGGMTIDGTSELVDAIAEAGPGTTITLTITRNGSSQTVDVTVGERDTSAQSMKVYKFSKSYPSFALRPPRFGRGRVGALPMSGGKVVHSKVVFENEDGSFNTHRKVIGTVSNLDTTAGTFTLSPKDGSDSIEYTISDDTQVNMSRSGDLGPLSTDDDTLVIDVDGEVKLVQQGEWPSKRSRFFRGGRSFGLEDGGIWRDRSHMADRRDMNEKAMEVLRSRLNDRK